MDYKMLVHTTSSRIPACLSGFKLFMPSPLNLSQSWSMLVNHSPTYTPAYNIDTHESSVSEFVPCHADMDMVVIRA